MSDGWLRGDNTRYNRILESVGRDQAEAVTGALNTGRVEKQSTELKPASLAGPLIFEAAVPTENAPDKLKRATSWKNCC
jgi:hypothetical protein